LIAPLRIQKEGVIMLKVMAVSAPHWEIKRITGAAKHLNSLVPFSLYNAVKNAASLAARGIGCWGKSNWKDLEERNESVFLMQYFENEKNHFEKQIQKIKPNLLLIGTMTLGFPGAVEIAKIAKKVLGNNVLIVLGGKHVNETVYLKRDAVKEHLASPLELMKSGKIPQVFDLVVSGDGEDVIVKIGELVDQLKDMNDIRFNRSLYENKLSEAMGDWLAVWNNEKKTYYIKSKGKPIDYSRNLSMLDLFGVKGKFDIFDKDYTVHLYANTGRGCVHNCFFCSEKVEINGKPKNIMEAPFQLVEDLAKIKEYANKEYGKNNISAFVENSIFLNGNKQAIEKFLKIIKEAKPGVDFGVQLTIDLLLDDDIQTYIGELTDFGLKYIFWGLETNNNEIANQINKNREKTSWVDRNEEAISFISKIGIDCGLSLIFGLGESHEERVALFKKLIDLKKNYGKPDILSMNLGTKHPLQEEDNATNYEYYKWGTPKDSDYAPILIDLFGEASVNYKLTNNHFPSIEELKDIKKMYDLFQDIQVTKKYVKHCIIPSKEVDYMFPVFQAI
jgi:B12-binding domain/radical SAM domain protein